MNKQYLFVNIIWDLILSCVPNVFYKETQGVTLTHSVNGEDKKTEHNLKLLFKYEESKYKKLTE